MQGKFCMYVQDLKRSQNVTSKILVVEYIDIELVIVDPLMKRHHQ